MWCTRRFSASAAPSPRASPMYRWMAQPPAQTYQLHRRGRGWRESAHGARVALPADVALVVVGRAVAGVRVVRRAALVGLRAASATGERSRGLGARRHQRRAVVLAGRQASWPSRSAAPAATRTSTCWIWLRRASPVSRMIQPSTRRPCGAPDGTVAVLHLGPRRRAADLPHRRAARATGRSASPSAAPTTRAHA